MALEIVAAKDISHAIDMVLAKPRKLTKNYIAVQPDEIGDFLYDFKDSFVNYDFYYQFDPYMETYLEPGKVPAIKSFSDSIVKWISENGALENRIIEKYGLSMKKIKCFAIALDSVCDTAINNGYGLVGIGD